MYSLPNVRCGSLPHELTQSGACRCSGWFTGKQEVIDRSKCSGTGAGVDAKHFQAALANAAIMSFKLLDKFLALAVFPMASSA